MSWLSEEELVEHLKRLEKREPSPSFVDTLEERLVRKGKSLHRQRLRRTWSVQAASIVVIGALTVGLFGAPTIHPKQESTLAIHTPLRPDIQMTPPPETLKEENRGTTVHEQQPVVPEQAIRVVPQTPALEQPTREAVLSPPTVKQLARTEHRNENDPERQAFEKLATARLEQMVGKDSMHKYAIHEDLSSYREHGAEIVFTRVVNGLPYIDEAYRIGVSAKKEVTGMHMTVDLENRADNAPFPDANDRMSLNEAQQAFAQQLKLVYVQNQVLKHDYFGRTLKSSPTLQYVLPSTIGIDAKSGKEVEIKGDRSEWSGEIITVQPEGKSLKAGSIAEAKALLEQLHLDADVSNLEEIQNGEQTRYIWNQGELGVEASSGNLVYFEVEKQAGRAGGERISQDQAKQRAVQFIQQYLSVDVEELILQKTSVNQASATLQLHFLAAYQGIPVLDQPYVVMVDEVSGDVVGFHGGFAQKQVALPDPKNAVAAEVAVEKILKESPLHLVYVWSKQLDKPVLVYKPLKGFAGSVYFDAIKGEFVSIGP